MNVTGGGITAEVDAEDIKNLMKSGATQISDPDAEVTVKIRCKQSLQFQVVTPDGEQE